MATMSATLAAMRQGLMEYLGEWVSSTTSAAGNAGGTTFPDSVNLANYGDDYFNTWWALFTASSEAGIVGQVRRVSDFAQSTGTVTAIAAYGAPTQVPSGSTYELLHYHPTTLIRWALNKALQELFPGLPKSILNEDLVTGNALPNGNFRTWNTATHPDQWVATTITAAKETSVVKYGTASAKLTGSAGYIGCEAMTGASTVWLPMLDLAGKAIPFEAWTKTATASHVRLALVDDDGTTYSSYHTGGNGWELLKVERTIKSGTKAIAARVYGDVGSTTAYVSNARVMGTPVSQYLLPDEFTIGDVDNLYIQNGSKQLTGDERPCDDIGWLNPPTPWPHYDVRYDNRLGLWLLELKSIPSEGYKMRIVGKDPIAKVTSDTDTVPLLEPQLNLLYAYAAYRLFMTIGMPQKAQEKLQEYQMLRRDHELEAEPLNLIPESVVD